MTVEQRAPGFALIRHAGGLHAAKSYEAFCPESLGGCGWTTEQFAGDDAARHAFEAALAHRKEGCA